MIANESLDTYSSSLRRSLVDVNSHKVGLGLVLRVNNDGEIVIKELIHGYAAQRQGGLREGDVLVTIDGHKVQDYNLEEIKNLTFGEEGSLVTIDIRRDGTDQKVTLQRISGAGQSNTLMSSVRSSYAES
ncbi:hypothetical protein GUITHDRAFT_154494 [Guillardia theta CCMP2712]|uniref:PDZ domain-containing protein n=1 Tax=Guillardia theta (strain CCMP2712) TaxID=905079 RepID=L1ISK6_GUITC|nr:hypothetical protein GUITHDRAFT_154494 [Guillardia theta CCMP2712]EKX39251.1 hypothetical protein GUITHDRAFT_154494 [Guillardia theta CCMP2712]|eukprot:XP_005826231.1 hypothetical protein GUITHDRAFT_154494 [Guillardia theta CCMP2712]